MTLKEKEHLKVHNKSMDWNAYNNRRRWNSTQKREVSLAHILQKGRQVKAHPSTKLKKAIQEFDRKHPQYKNSLSYETVGIMWLVIGYFFMKKNITAPIYNYLLYTLYMDWKEQRKFRDKPKVKKEMLKHLEELGIINLIFKEATNKLIHLDIPPIYDGKYRKPTEEYVSLKDAISNNTTLGLGFDSYSFDK